MKAKKMAWIAPVAVVGLAVGALMFWCHKRMAKDKMMDKGSSEKAA